MKKLWNQLPKKAKVIVAAVVLVMAAAAYLFF